MEYPLITVAETRPFQRKVAHTPGQGLEARVMSKAFAEIGAGLDDAIALLKVVDHDPKAVIHAIND
jgi:hypothetical protein